MAQDRWLAEQQLKAQERQRKTGFFGGLLQTLGGLAGGGALFSDRRLKQNVEKVSQVGPLGFYSWDWKDGSGSSLGFMADEVEKWHPSAVSTDDAGLQLVNYGDVFRQLAAEGY